MKQKKETRWRNEERIFKDEMSDYEIKELINLKKSFSKYVINIDMLEFDFYDISQNSVVSLLRGI